MTDNMKRLQELINESKKIREDIEQETNKLKDEHLANRKAKYYKVCQILRPYFELCKGVIPKGESYLNVFMGSDKDSKYKIRFEGPAPTIGVQGVSQSGNTYWIGRFDIRDSYEDSNRRLTIEKGFNFVKTYYLDTFIDAFDEAVLEENFAQVITDQLAKMAKETDEAYQDAKAKLEADKEN